MNSITQQKMNDKAIRFYLSFEWRKIRYLVLKDHVGRCMLCNRSDLPLHVDHIKPLKKYWSLRLEYTNLQILCEECNHGKGNWDETDWRPLSKKKLQREYDAIKAQEKFDKEQEDWRKMVDSKLGTADEFYRQRSKKLKDRLTKARSK